MPVSWLLLPVVAVLAFGAGFTWSGIYELRAHEAVVWRINRFTGSTVMCEPVAASRDFYVPVCTSARSLSFADAVARFEATDTPTPTPKPR